MKLSDQARVGHKQLGHLVTDIGDPERLLTGGFSFGHLPASSHPARLWLWRNLHQAIAVSTSHQPSFLNSDFS